MNALVRDLSNTEVVTTSSQAEPRLVPSAKSISAEEIFRERCEARAILTEAAEFSLQDAVDVLQADAERTGPVDMLGQDAVQKMMVEAFGPVANATNVAPRLPASTIMAAEYLVRLNNPKRQRAWLAKHTAAECKAILRHIEEIEP
jgi:hypothetical protein